MNSLAKRFSEGLSALGLPALPFDPFSRYMQQLSKWNQVINLTRITKPDEIIEKHFLDSLACLLVIGPGPDVSRGTLLDLGSGAGFPGIPIKLARPDLKVYLADPVKKKCDFLKAVIRGLGLQDIEVLNQSIESGSSLPAMDWVVTRATLSLDDFTKAAAPHLKQNGRMMAMVSAADADRLGVPPKELVRWDRRDYELPYSKAHRALMVSKIHR